ncbi:MAG: hypothetical protein IT203_02610 [Fimbriimonadaceae bacterium]|nr:hypothetical protein [Fimbriimonadaceae bacterium]
MAQRRFKNPLDLYNAQMARMAKANASIADGLKMMREGATQDAIDLTGGHLTPKQTRGQYARGRAAILSTPNGRKRGTAPMLPINMVSGRLRRSIQGRSWKKNGFAVVSKGVPYSQFILSESGTRVMVARGMKRKALSLLRSRNKAFKDFFFKNVRST